MIRQIKDAWRGYLRPMLRRPPGLQVAALCCRGKGARTQVLLVTSRGSGRWIIPKGWPVRGKDAAESALQEAWEEAGVRRGRMKQDSIGTYTYDKYRSGGWPMPVETLVYRVAVEEMADDFPEARERRRKWFSPGEAANLVQEPELQDILRAL